MAAKAGSGICEASSPMMILQLASNSWKRPPGRVDLSSDDVVIQSMAGNRTRIMSPTAYSVASEFSSSAILNSSRSSSVRLTVSALLKSSRSISRRPWAYALRRSSSLGPNASGKLVRRPWRML
ncbi:unnamed protein product [Haemonchus placei]|uniref:Uncharacterized protein n=1 Tax=Haemonchus placei TaxID=6290 RepID=A0A0N4WJI3_HAEPC|nr:unnamed protein product [Haemonchus placei]